MREDGHTESIPPVRAGMNPVSGTQRLAIAREGSGQQDGLACEDPSQGFDHLSLENPKLIRMNGLLRGCFSVRLAKLAPKEVLGPGLSGAVPWSSGSRVLLGQFI